MRRIFAVLLTFVVLVSMVTPCFAAESEASAVASRAAAESEASAVTPRYLCIALNAVDFYIEEASTNTVTSDVYCLLYDNYEVQIVCELQRYNNSKWNTIKTWTSSGMQEASLTKSWVVPGGYNYRAYATFYIYDNQGFLMETATNYNSVYVPSN
ncbi:MAG: hypothetical protein E7454_04560 [Ruminococcaceae bacterium]|nr:hypothetical protein [Oscillospiraceae bacterium]